jgi:hypothetical protein
MRQIIILVFISICFGIALEANAVSVDIKQKYPYPLLTDDYEILDENDIAAYTWGLKLRPFTTKGPSGEYTYWQCFPRELIEVTLIDTGTTALEFGKDNIGDLQIRVWVKPELIHQYDMRARWGVMDFEKRFNKWQKIMKNAKYVCVAGSFTRLEHKLEDSRVRAIYHWTFEKMKTPNGCDSYFGSCTPTYQKYLQEKLKKISYENSYLNNKAEYLGLFILRQRSSLTD